MSNEVIIDDCNVTECEFYDDLECNAYCQEYWEPQDNTKDFCKEHPNCYFKQLQRLKDNYKQAFEDIIKYCNVYSKTEDYVIDQTFSEFLENVFNKINGVLNK